MSASPPRASRLASPRWLDGRLAAGVLLVLVAVVVGARVVAAADHDTAVYVARHPLVPGERLTAGDLVVGRVHFADHGAAYVAAGREPIGYVVTRYVGASELLPAAALTPAGGPTTATRTVTVPVAPGHLPTGLGHGDLVDLYVTAKPAAGSAVAPPTLVLAGVPVDSDDGGSRTFGGSASTVSVVLDVPVSKVAAVVHAAESGTVDLVGVPPGGCGVVAVCRAQQPDRRRDDQQPG